MSVIIDLSRDIEQRLFDRASQGGSAPPKTWRGNLSNQAFKSTLDEDLAQFRKAILDSGESEEESAAFINAL